MDDLREFSHSLRNLLSVLYAQAETLELALRERGADAEQERAMAAAIIESGRDIEKLMVQEIDRRRSKS